MSIDDDGWAYDLVPLPDGRTLEVLVRGTQERAVVWWTGTPGAGVRNDRISAVMDAHDVRLIIPLRPGYGRSTPLPGRCIAEAVGDVGPVLDHLGVREVVSIGFSGGGPHALATAALVPTCRAASVVVSPAPRDAEGLDYYDGMGLANQEEWRLADQGEAAVRPWLDKEFAGLDDAPPEGIFSLFGDCLCPPDAQALQIPGRSELTARSMAKALEAGCEGWLGDDIALTTPWGFGLDAVTVPVAFWAGRQDRFISWHHSVWLQERVAGSDLFVHADHGHISLYEAHLPAMVADLVAKAGW